MSITYEKNNLKYIVTNSDEPIASDTWFDEILYYDDDKKEPIVDENGYIQVKRHVNRTGVGVSEATNAFSGKVRLATIQEVAEGKSNDCAITPATLLSALQDAIDNPLQKAAGVKFVSTVVSDPVVVGSNAVIGIATKFVCNAYCGLNNTYIDHFEISFSTGDSFTIEAKDGRAEYTYMVPLDVPEGETILMYVTAYDNIGNSSRTIEKQMIASKICIETPTITFPSNDDIIVYNEGFTVKGSVFNLVGIGSDTHVETKVIIKTYPTDDEVNVLTFTETNICKLDAKDLNFVNGQKYSIYIQYRGENNGWSSLSKPIVVTMKSSVRTPKIISPEEGGSFYNIKGLKVQVEKFVPDFLVDTFSKRTFEIRDTSGTVLVTKETTTDDIFDFGNLTEYNLPDTVKLYVQDTATKYGDSNWSEPVTLRALKSSSIQSEMYLPQQNAELSASYGIMCALHDPDIPNGKNSVQSCDFQIAKGSDGSQIILSVNDTNQRHYFTAEECTDLIPGQTYYARARHNLTTGETLAWDTVNFQITSIDKTNITPGNRVIYVHDSNKGVVVEYNYFNTTRRIFVPFAQYRASAVFYDERNPSMIDGLYNFATSNECFSDNNNYIYRTVNELIPTFVANSTSTVDTSEYNDIESVSDEKLNTWLQQFKDKELQTTAHACTTAILNYYGNINYSNVIKYCRNLNDVFLDGCDLPLVHDLCILYIEGDFIDALDHTLADFPNYALGRYTNAKRWFNGGSVWSCQQSSYMIKTMNSDGSVSDSWKTRNRVIIPIKELN